MRVLIVGSGGREHAIAWALRRSPHVSEVFCAPGNAGIADVATTVPVDVADVVAVVAAARSVRADLTVIGPEGPLAAGVVDALEGAGLRAFGPTRAAARIESSKVFAKQLLARHRIPQAEFRSFDRPEEALAWIRRRNAPCVVKADGLAAGKGAVVCATAEEAGAAVRAIMVERRFGDAGRRVVIEEFLEGQELSALAFVDGECVLPMPPARDHKRLLDGDCGPNTGGMGAMTPVPDVSPDLHRRIVREVLEPAAGALVAEGCPFRGVLYAGLMLTADGPKVLEFNARWGDPEAQALLPLLETDLFEALWASCEGRLDAQRPSWSGRSAVCVVAASEGYPDEPVCGRPIHGLAEARALPDVLVFHAATACRDDRIVTAGGRVVDVVGLGDDLAAAREAAYRAMVLIHFDGMHCRQDIGVSARPSTVGVPAWERAR
ncbi:MAG: phosphoribosylamine--glycine ligase [Armatimonadota bacterium]|nr:phosphoribosylamine--glycine ligase [Armatimonadota bacterium]MDR5697843.1 phosphoribosylamine--glycine ligase [Armatimonadota bacterium]